MAQLGVVIWKTGQYVAKIDTLAAGARYKMLGPPRGAYRPQANGGAQKC